MTGLMNVYPRPPSKWDEIEAWVATNCAKKKGCVFFQNVNNCWATLSHCELGTSCID